MRLFGNLLFISFIIFIFLNDLPAGASLPGAILLCLTMILAALTYKLNSVVVSISILTLNLIALLCLMFSIQISISAGFIYSIDWYYFYGGLFFMILSSIGYGYEIKRCINIQRKQSEEQPTSHTK